MKKINLIDSFGLFFRLYYAMMGLKSKDGKPSGMISGLATFVGNLERDFPADYTIFALEGGGKTFRHEIYEAYKANRSEAPEGLKEQIPVCIEMIEKMGFCAVSKPGFEADDIIASLATKYGSEYEINILSSDKDLFALISENVRIVDSKNKIFYDAFGCKEKYGVFPNQIRDYLSITGDSSDNVPGIKGLGERGARVLLEEFGSLENAYNNLEKITNKRTKNLLEQGKESCELSKRLITLATDVGDLPDLNQAVMPKNPLLKVRDILEKYSLNRILAKLPQNTENSLFDESEFSKNSKNSKEILENSKNSGAKNSKLSFKNILILDENELLNISSKITPNDEIAFDTETTGLDVKSAKIVGFSFAIKGDFDEQNEQKAYYVPLAHNYLGVPQQVSISTAKTAIERIFKALVIGHNLKYDFEIVRNNFGLEIPTNYADTMILAWLENPEQRCNMDDLALKLFSYETKKFTELVNVKNGENFGDVELETACFYASEDAFITLKFYEFYKNNLSEQLWDIAKNVEFAFIKTLSLMQNSGIKADFDKLSALNDEISDKISILEREIYSIANESFNINSPKQLGVVLFEHLGLEAKKKTKSGYSTDESVLSSLSHPIAKPLLEYRELAKLKGTYTEPFMRLSKNGERIFTQFLHTGTATGRLSSQNPNLQNIPTRTEQGKKVRNCFVAGVNNTLISLDYSQIELRLLAHFSCDPALSAAFKNNEDIHARTAISIFGDSIAEHRSIAKSINFGLIYGMGSTKLAQNLGIQRAVAKEYINKYFQSFPTIKSYLESIKSYAHENGFVSTILGRQRHFDFDGANEKTIALYEREAVNSVFQGSAADIIKLAMNQIAALLNDEIKMILQIHDELIFEVKENLASEFATKIAQIMENVIALNVPLKVNFSIAKSWGELK